MTHSPTPGGWADPTPPGTGGAVGPGDAVPGAGGAPQVGPASPTSGGWVDPAQPAAMPGLPPPQPPYLPYATPAAAPPGYGLMPQYGFLPPKPKTNGLAVASLVVSIVGAVGLFCYGIGGLIGAVGAILGHVGRRQIRERGEEGDGMALAGVIIGWIATALGLLIIGLVVTIIVIAASEPY